MKRPELVIILGFILVFLGMMLLLTSSSDFEGGFVFVFPFFFFGNVDSFSIISIVAFLFFIAVFLILIFGNWFYFKQPDIMSEERRVLIIFDSKCAFCGEAIPKTARYCPACGQEQSNQLD